MEKRLRIGSIKLLFQYRHTEYFEPSIEAYVDEGINPEYTMFVTVEDAIPAPEGKLIGTSGGRKRYAAPAGETIIREDSENTITHRMDLSADRRQAHVYLHTSLKERLPEAEYIFTGMMFFEMALNEGYLPIHASAVDVGEEALLFAGPSTSGKSTQANLWKKHRNDTCVILNDDKPLLFVRKGKSFVLGTPWSGKERRNENRTTGVSHILFIDKAQTNQLKTMTTSEKIKEMMRNVVRPGREKSIRLVTDLVSRVIDTAPMQRFLCTKEDSAYRFLSDRLNL